MRAPYQILVFPFVREGEKYYYAVFKREDLNVWQGIAGGGEEGEKPIETARREGYEEASIDRGSRYIGLASIFTIPAVKICGLKWGKEIIMIPEFAFGVELPSRKLKVGSEHTQYLWLSCEDAINKLEWDSNKVALWELDHRLKNGSLDGIEKNAQVIRRFL
ncbi:MAG: NUDIX domain-containing protein [bacterium]|nr:NUDIX domain-containing protein [bacterium]